MGTTHHLLVFPINCCRFPEALNRMLGIRISTPTTSISRLPPGFRGQPVRWRPLHQTEEDDSSVPGRLTEDDIVFLLRKGVPVQCTSLVVTADGGRRECGDRRRPGCGGDRVVRDGDDFGRGCDLDFPAIFKRKVMSSLFGDWKTCCHVYRQDEEVFELKVEEHVSDSGRMDATRQIP